MTRAAFVIPGDIDRPTGGYAYDRRVLALLPRFGVDVSHLALSGSYPSPSDADLKHTAAQVAETTVDCVLLIDGLAYGAMPAALIDGFARGVVALVHHPLCLETGLSEARAEELRAFEQVALARASAVIATSPATAKTISGMFDVPAERLHVAEPGTDRVPRAVGGGEKIKLLAVGSVVPRKGYDVLIDALRLHRGKPWHLDIVGQPLDPAYNAALKQQVERAGLNAQINFAGAVDADRLKALYNAADVFVMPSRYEGYGMVMAEALARGLPVICTIGVVAADTVPTDATLRVEVDDAQALSAAIGKVLGNDTLRRALSDAAWQAAQALPTWEATTERIADVLKQVAR